MTEFKTNKEYLTARKQAYQAVFGSERAALVKDDMQRFCRAGESTFHPDPRVEGLLQGRREVWLRIEQHLNLSPDELVAVFDPAGVATGED